MPTPTNLLRRATETGFYGARRIHIGQVFNLLNVNHHQSRWMEEVPPETPVDVVVTRLSGSRTRVDN
jgi:hypothetical protein